MRFTRSKAIIATVGLALSLAACGDAGGDSEGADVEVADDATSNFDDGTRMKELADAGTIKVGVKYDQPGLGFKDAASDIPTGFDVEIAKLLVADLGIDPEDTSATTWEPCGSGSGCRRPTTPTTSSPTCTRSRWGTTRSCCAPAPGSPWRS